MDREHNIVLFVSGAVDPERFIPYPTLKDIDQ
jgi:hypothetical protein